MRQAFENKIAAVVAAQLVIGDGEPVAQLHHLDLLAEELVHAVFDGGLNFTGAEDAALFLH